MTLTPITSEGGTHPNHAVGEVRYETPGTLSTAVARETATHVWVLCEGGCGTAITVSKARWSPDGEPDGPWLELRITAAPARRCLACGPFKARGR